MSELEKIKWYLMELANADPESIDSNELEIYGEDNEGREGSFTENITDIAEKSLKKIEEMEAGLQYFIDRVEAGTARSKVTYEMYKAILGNSKGPGG